MLVDLSLQLEIGQVVDLGYLRAGRDPLSELCVEPAYLAVDRRLDAQIFQLLAHEHHILAHVVETVFQLLDLHFSLKRILPLSVDKDLKPQFGKRVSLLGL